MIVYKAIISQSYACGFLAHIIISRIRSHGYMETTIWRHRGTNDGYQKSVAAILVTVATEVVVTGCVEAVTVPEEVAKLEEGKEWQNKSDNDQQCWRIGFDS